MEGAFGVLIKRCEIIDGPFQLCFTDDIRDVINESCIIHNMAVEYRRIEYAGDAIGGSRKQRVERETSGELVETDVMDKGAFI